MALDFSTNFPWSDWAHRQDRTSLQQPELSADNPLAFNAGLTSFQIGHVWIVRSPDPDTRTTLVTPCSFHILPAVGLVHPNLRFGAGRLDIFSSDE
jgi:hypothetical protein